jgi:hypothetical protein
MDVAVAHHDALGLVLRERDPGEAGAIVRAAGDFLLETLAASDMVQRGFGEAQEAARRERHAVEMIRQLSHFLADTSLAFDGPEALSEGLRLVAEQARELARADATLLTLGGEPQAHALTASYPEDAIGWTAFVRWSDLAPVESIVRNAAAPAEAAAATQSPG